MDRLNLALVIAMLPLVIGVNFVGLVARVIDNWEARFGRRKQLAYIPVRANLQARRSGM
jgi:hypothetical protein